MRIFAIIGIFTFVMAGCKKDSTSDCVLYQSIFNNNPTTTSTYEYDDQGRIKSITGTNNNKQEYTYYKDSVVFTAGNTRTTYYLNSNGLSDSAIVVFNPNPNGLGFNNSYTYNSEGYLVGSREIFKQVFNGNILRDTTYSQFTYENGNLTKAIQTGSAETHYEYTTLAAGPNSLYQPGAPETGAFLGKRSKNLLSKSMDQAGNFLYTYSYKFDSHKNVTRRTETFQDGSKMKFSTVINASDK